MAKKAFYTVWVGRVPGVYASWEDCQKQVKGFSGASFRGFISREQAEEAFAQGSDMQTAKVEQEPAEQSPITPMQMMQVASQAIEHTIEGECEYF